MVEEVKTMFTQNEITKTQYVPEYLQIAHSLSPVFQKEQCLPLRKVRFQKQQGALHTVGVIDLGPASFPMESLEKQKPQFYDFGQHVVGHVFFTLETIGPPQDAPIKIRISFGEMPCELFGYRESYAGWLSDTWFQEEIVTVDSTPQHIAVPRRFAFRYVCLEILGISQKNTVRLSSLHCIRETSAPTFEVATSKYKGLLGSIDEVSRTTLRECMQSVFEDGPKRDRRLWLGDLRLQALTNYASYKHYDLVKRCLYLFAGMCDAQGRVPSCIYLHPQPHPDTIYLFDYYVLFIPTLLEYVQASGDLPTLRTLWPVARKQISIAMSLLEQDMVREDPTWWAFIDWDDSLDKRLAAQGTFLYCLKSAISITSLLNDQDDHNELLALQHRLKQASRKCFNKELRCFTSGTMQQVSWASQIWMVLGQTIEGDEAKALLLRTERLEHRPMTPYLMHYYVEALLEVGLYEKAREAITKLWGSMVNLGSDTFWEIHNPDDVMFSPYGSVAITSFCHAWSCTPTYLLQKLDEMGAVTH